MAQQKNLIKNNTSLPFCEPSYLLYPSPYYKKTHYEFQKKLRNFVDHELIPYVDKWDENESYPIELHQKAYKAGVYSPQFPKEYDGTPPENWDYFHYLIWCDEIARCGAGGLVAGLFISLQIGLSPLMNSNESNSNELKKKYASEIIRGEKIIALAVTEPGGGSDVSSINTTAITDPNDSNYYIVNGEKYFITSGLRAEWYTTAVITNKQANGHHDGISILLINKNTPGIYVSRMKTQGWWSSNTAHIVFKNVKVPKTYLIGKENEGWKVVMHNFNHERFMMSVHSNRYSRLCLEECIKYSQERKTFGKKLGEHQVIRHKIAEMVRHIESTQALLEQIAFMANNRVPEKDLAAIVALAKVQSTRTMGFVCRQAVQIFGGRGYIRGGRAAKVERLYREVRVNAIGGGSEEIMLDLATRQMKL